MGVNCKKKNDEKKMRIVNVKGDISEIQKTEVDLNLGGTFLFFQKTPKNKEFSIFS
jgi:hypothetical protein